MMNKKALELYVHIPFCVSKCDYCDFLSFAGNAMQQKYYVDQLIEEIKYEGFSIGDSVVTSVFIGGGTPSVMGEGVISRILSTIREHFSMSENPEISIEANPGTVSLERLKEYRAAGINRISIGLQSADNAELRYLGRIHSYDEFLKTFQRVRMAGFQNVNVDLMSALPGQTLDSWKDTLKKTIRLKPEHISAYSLIIEEGTPFYEHYGTDSGSMEHLPLPDEDTEREMYYAAKSVLGEAGYHRYEISNYARSGYECVHNIGYWTGIEYLGMGLGASSYIKNYRFRKESNLDTYLKADLKDQNQFERAMRQGLECLSNTERMEEFMMLGLRLIQGVSPHEFTARFGRNIFDVYGKVIEKLVQDGLMNTDGGMLRLTELGLDVSNYAMSQFLF